MAYVVGRDERDAEPEGGGRVERRPVGAGRAYVVGRDERDAGCRGERGEPPIEPLLGGIEMASEIDIKIAAAEDRTEPVAQRARIVAAGERERKRTARAAGQTDQSRAVALE